MQAPVVLGDDHDEDDEDDGSERCISMRAVRSTDVYDDNTIIFKASSSRYYVNFLPRSCRGLAREGRFSYETITTRLCEGDSIRTLQDIGGRLQEGMLCRLGRFYPATQDDLDAMVARDNVPVMPKEVDGATPEDVGNGEDTEQD